MRATSSNVSELYDRLLSVPRSTSRDYALRLQADPTILRKGRQGPNAPELTVSEITNWTIAVCAATSTTRRTPDALDVVKSARSATRVLGGDLIQRAPPEALEHLSIGDAPTAAEAIDALIRDMRTGAYAAWKGNRRSMLNVRFFNNCDRVIINTWKFSPEEGALEAALVYSPEYDSARQRIGGVYLTHVHELDGGLLEEIARLLGPTNRDTHGGRTISPSITMLR